MESARWSELSRVSSIFARTPGGQVEARQHLELGHVLAGLEVIGAEEEPVGAADQEPRPNARSRPIALAPEPAERSPQRFG